MPDDNNHPDGGQYHGTTRLYLRAYAGDNGDRPIPAPIHHYLSPAVVIVQPDGTVGGLAVPGEVNHVAVTVTNGGGMSAVDAFVEAFVVNPFTGPVAPAAAHLVGGVFATIHGYHDSTVQLPWIPQPTDIGHRCLIARISLVIPLDTYADPAVFDLRNDRHVAQRNIDILDVPAGDAMTFNFLVMPAETSPDHVVVTVFERSSEIDRDELTRLGGCAGGLPAVMPLAGFGLRVLDEGETPRLGRADRAEDITSTADVRIPALNRPRVVAVTVAVDPGDEAGRLHYVDITEFAQNGDELGGLALLVRVAR